MVSGFDFLNFLNKIVEIKTNPMAEQKRTLELYLWSMSVMYLFAFASLFVQIPGLYGDHGILPVKHVLQKAPDSLNDLVENQPSLLRVLPWFGILDVQTGMDSLCCLGIVLSFLSVVFQAFRNAITYFVLWVLYLSLFTVGQTFLWFQWDTLLLEVGFLTVIVAPLGLQSIRTRWFHQHDRITFWLIKWLAFRLMFCSGAVKLLSNCPTWWGLTALNHHYESQCIPTPAAWYAHQLPDWHKKLSVAMTFVIQIPVSLLFFSPFRNQRIFAFLNQVLLMVLIIITGNYNFFNWITIVLCLSLVDDDFLFTTRWTKKQAKDDERKQFLTISRLCCLGKCLINLIVYCTLLFATIYYFSIRLRLQPFSVDSSIAFTMSDLEEFLKISVPLSIWIGIICLGWEILTGLLRSLFLENGILKKTTNTFGCLLFGLVATWMFCLSLVPYTNIEMEMHHRLPGSFSKWFKATSSVQLTHSYGLFRRMTGVNGRPEVIIEGSEYIDRDWKEYNFLFKPGDVDRRPPIVAPHQPRLDWQMWFAALGNYNHNPWFINLVYRLLTNQTEVIQLIDKGPFDKAPPNYIRAKLYHYYYTSYNSSSKDWWRREFVGEYFPTVWKTDPGLINYLKSVGIYEDPDQPVMTRQDCSLTHIMDKLHSVFQPSDGYSFCIALLATAFSFLLIKGVISGPS